MSTSPTFRYSLHRRTLLASLAAATSGAAGCLEVIRSGPESASESTPNDPGTSPGTSTDEYVTAGLHRGTIEATVHDRVNEVRRDHGLDDLDRDPALREIARSHSEDMAARDYFSHVSPEGETPADRYDEFGYDCRVSTGGGRFATGGENLHTVSYEGVERTEPEIARGAVEGWMTSPGHRENLLRGYWENEGIGVAIRETSGRVAVFTTQNFC